MIKENQKEECIKKVEGGNEGDSLAAGAADARERERKKEVDWTNDSPPSPPLLRHCSALSFLFLIS